MSKKSCEGFGPLENSHKNFWRNSQKTSEVPVEVFDGMLKDFSGNNPEINLEVSQQFVEELLEKKIFRWIHGEIPSGISGVKFWKSLENPLKIFWRNYRRASWSASRNFLRDISEKKSVKTSGKCQKELLDEFQGNFLEEYLVEFEILDFKKKHWRTSWKNSSSKPWSNLSRKFMEDSREASLQRRHKCCISSMKQGSIEEMVSILASSIRRRS